MVYSDFFGDAPLSRVKDEGVSPSHLGPDWVFELGLTRLGLGLGGLETKEWD